MTYPMTNQFNAPTAQPYMANQIGSMFRSPKRTLPMVNGIEGAQAFQMQPGERVALFDANNDILYIKSTDDAGYASINTYQFQEIKPETTEYVTRSEFEQLREVIENGFKSIQQPTNTATDATEPTTA